MDGPAAGRGHAGAGFEPLTLWSAMAAVTERIGFAATVSTTYNEPWHVARKFASLDLISAGRAAWNVVTSANEYAAGNFGTTHPDHATRDERATEFLEVVLGLWDSWETDAFSRDKQSGLWSALPASAAGEQCNASRAMCTLARVAVTAASAASRRKPRCSCTCLMRCAMPRLPSYATHWALVAIGLATAAGAASSRATASRVKKTGHAAEQDRRDVLTQRWECFENQPDLDPDRLVFVDETWASTKMARTHGSAPRGEWPRAAIPHGHWMTTTFVAGLRS